MVIVLIVYLLVIFVMFGVVALMIRLCIKNRSECEDDSLFDEDGYHEYYDRSIIEKQQFVRKHPGEPSPRTFRRLFSRKR